MNRRQFLRSSSLGFGWLGLQHLLQAQQRPHFMPKARSVILVYLSGGLSQVDSFDPKPILKKYAGEAMPMPLKATMFDDVGQIMPSPWEFKNRGKSGLPISELFPCISEQADELCIIRSMPSKVSEHAQANFYFHSGFSFQGHPSAGAWMSYGLGTENRNLPSYIVLRSGDAVDPIGGRGVYSNGFLPARYQPSFISVDKDPSLVNLKPQEDASSQLDKIATMQKLDAEFMQNLGVSSNVEAAISNYEIAFQMQSSVPEICELQRESKITKELYGVDSSHSQTAAFAKQCLVARRMVERGVRFIELSCLPETKSGGQNMNPWDQHSKIKAGHANMAKQVDQPVAALLLDLKARGLLDSTIVVFSGEFGRTPFAQGSDGRDHNPSGFSLWLAGGGFKKGVIYGQTDEFGYYTIDKPLSIYDLWATIQHQLGINHEKLTYHFGGRNFRLSDVEGHVITDLV